ncbi:hypothetical protein [Geodermatophilus sp. SYSU D00815]
MAGDPESAVPAAADVHLVLLSWDGPHGRFRQREGARLDAALLYARMSAGDPGAELVVHRFLDAWREYLRLSLAGLADELGPLRGEPVELGTGDVFQQWAALAATLVDLWPDAEADAATASRALIRLQTAFTSERVDVAAVHREMLAVANLFSGIEARAEASLECLRERHDPS